MSQAENVRDPLMGEGEGESASPGAFTLQVVSPSVGVTGPLSFPKLPASTTVKQLKERIRESLAMRPSDDQQRLIHRGRLLARENETISEIFGHETIKSSESQTLHLVLKPSASEDSSLQSAVSSPPQQPPPPPNQGPPTPYYFRIPPPPQLPELLRETEAEARQRALNIPANTAPSREIRIPTPPQFPAPPLPPQIGLPNAPAELNRQGHIQHHDPQVAQTIQVIQQLQQDHARLHQERLNQNHPVPGLPGLPGLPGALPHQIPGQTPPVMPSFQHLIAQHQRDRAALGMHGVQHQGLQQGASTIPIVPHPGQQIQPNRSMHRPQQTRTTTHEMNGPDGQRWTVTVNETTTFLPNSNGSHIPARTTLDNTSLRDAQDMVQSIVRAVDGNSNALQSQPHQLGLNSLANPGSSTSTDGAVSRPASGPPADIITPSPLPTNNVRALSENIVPSTNRSSDTPTLGGPVVYILSSPNGPRGLLVSPSENGLEAFYTPRRQVHWHNPSQIQQFQNPVQVQNEAAHGVTEVRHRREGRHAHMHHHGHHHGEAAARAVPGVAHPGNPPAGAVAAQMWPHIWLVIRLLGFVWFFTSGSNSWGRLFMFSAVAFIIFVASTGIFNGIIEQAWGPIRRHLENLLPLAVPQAPPALPPDQPAGAVAPAQGQAAGVVGTAAIPDPAQTAARLFEQRRAANENWIWTQFRRLEHATILFVASLVPGVGERHIAARVAEENLLLEAQRQNREAEATAADEAARATEEVQENGANVPATGTDTDTTGVDTPTTDIEEGGTSVQRQGGNATGGVSNPSTGDIEAGPLIEV